MREYKIESAKDRRAADARVELLGDLSFKLKRIHNELLDGEEIENRDLGDIAQAAIIFEGEHDELKRAAEGAKWRLETKANAQKPAAPARQARKPPAAPAKKRGRTPQSSGTDAHPGERHRYDSVSGLCTVPRLTALGGGECGALTPRAKGKGVSRHTPPALDWDTMKAKKTDAPAKRLRVQMTDADGNDVGDAIDPSKAAAE